MSTFRRVSYNDHPPATAPGNSLGQTHASDYFPPPSQLPRPYEMNGSGPAAVPGHLASNPHSQQPTQLARIDGIEEELVIIGSGIGNTYEPQSNTRTRLPMILPNLKYNYPKSSVHSFSPGTSLVFNAYKSHRALLPQLYQTETATDDDRDHYDDNNADRDPRGRDYDHQQQQQQPRIQSHSPQQPGWPPTRYLRHDSESSTSTSASASQTDQNQPYPHTPAPIAPPPSSHQSSSHEHRYSPYHQHQHLHSHSHPQPPSRRESSPGRGHGGHTQQSYHAVEPRWHDGPYRDQQRTGPATHEYESSSHDGCNSRSPPAIPRKNGPPNHDPASMTAHSPVPLDGSRDLPGRMTDRYQQQQQQQQYRQRPPPPPPPAVSARGPPGQGGPLGEPMKDGVVLDQGPLYAERSRDDYAYHSTQFTTSGVLRTGDYPPNQQQHSQHSPHPQHSQPQQQQQQSYTTPYHAGQRVTSESWSGEGPADSSRPHSSAAIDIPQSRHHQHHRAAANGHNGHGGYGYEYERFEHEPMDVDNKVPTLGHTHAHTQSQPPLPQQHSSQSQQQQRQQEAVPPGPGAGEHAGYRGPGQPYHTSGPHYALSKVNYRMIYEYAREIRDCLIKGKAGTTDRLLYNAEILGKVFMGCRTDQDPAAPTEEESALNPHQLRCTSCNIVKTPEWRKGPLGPRTLCNACGLIWGKMSRSKAQAAKNSAAANAAAKIASVDQAVPVVADSVMTESQQENPNSTSSSSSSSSQPSTMSGSRKRGREQGARRGEASQEDDQIGDSGEAAEAKAWEQDLETHESSLKAVEALSLTDKAVGSFHSQGAWNMTDRSPAEQPGSRDLGHGSSNIGSSNNNGSSDNHRLQPPSQPFPVDSPEVNDQARSWENERRVGVSSLGIAVAAVATLPAKGEDEDEDSTMREQGFVGSGPRAVQAGVFADGSMTAQSPAQTAPSSPLDAGRKLALSFLLA